MSGVGVPQLTAIADSVKVAAPAGIPVIADGGIRFSGDLVKALASGSHSVMIGGLFAGTEESPGETILCGLKAGMGYTGCRTLAELRTKAKFMRVTSAGLRENHVHDVIITKEAPNYRLE